MMLLRFSVNSSQAPPRSLSDHPPPIGRGRAGADSTPRESMSTTVGLIRFESHLI